MPETDIQGGSSEISLMLNDESGEGHEKENGRRLSGALSVGGSGEIMFYKRLKNRAYGSD